MNTTQKFTPSQITSRGRIIPGSTLSPKEASRFNWNINNVDQVNGKSVKTIHFGFDDECNGAIMTSGHGGVGLHSVDSESLIGLIAQAERGDFNHITAGADIKFKS